MLLRNIYNINIYKININNINIISSNMTAANTPQPIDIKFNPNKCVLNKDTNELISKYTYENVVFDENNQLQTTSTNYQFKVDLSKPNKLGILLVGLGGNNGSTLFSTVKCLQNGISFHNGKFDTTKEPLYGSMTQCSTIKLGVDIQGNDIFVPFKDILPMADPANFVVSGWDINGANMAEAIERSQVLQYDLIQNLKPYLKSTVPMSSVYYPDFIALNQKNRANNICNLVENPQKWHDLQKIRNDIKTFKHENDLDQVIVLWTANTERCVDIIPGVNDTAENILAAIKANHEEIAPSNIFAIASILEGVPYINGSPQNTFVPGIIELAERENTLIAGDDFKTGQTKLKSVMMQFLVDAGIKPVSIASYNHLGNNDGKNLSSHAQFRSKEISKASVIDDCIDSNKILYPESELKEKDNHVDHCIVIKYLPAVGDSKVAMDEYYSELMLGGHNRISVHNVCEDSLLATPIIIDLLIMTEFFSRITYKKIVDGVETSEFNEFYPILTFLSYWLKAPLTRSGFKPINSLNRQRLALENFLRLLIGLPANNELRFEERLM